MAYDRAYIDGLHELRRLIDSALQVALQIDQRTTSYILSMASLDVAEAIDHAENLSPDGAQDNEDTSDEPKENPARGPHQGLN